MRHWLAVVFDVLGWARLDKVSRLKGPVAVGLHGFDENLGFLPAIASGEAVSRPVEDEYFHSYASV